MKFSNHSLKEKNVSNKSGVSLPAGSLYDTGYIHFVIPLLYFIILLFAAMTNRPIGAYELETDFYWTYAPQAKEFLQGNLVIDPYKGPVYQIILALTGFLFKGDFFAAGKFINVLFAAVSLFFISKITASLSDLKTALLVTLLVSVNTYFIKFSYQPGTDMLFLAIYSSAVFIILKNDGNKVKNFFFAGVLSGTAYLTRYTALSLILSVFLILIFYFYKNYKSGDKLSFRESVKLMSAYFLPVIAMAAVWGFICLRKTGSFFYNLNYLNTALAVYRPENVRADDWTLNYENTFGSFADVVFRNSGQFFYKIFIENFTGYFINDLSRLMPLFTGVIAAFGLILFFVKFKSRPLNQKYFFLFSILFYIQILFAFYSERFSLPLLPFYSFLIVNILNYDFLQKYNFKFGKINLFNVSAVILISFNLILSYGFIKTDLNAVPVEVLNISEWVKKNRNENLSGKTIMSRKPQIAYYLDMKFEVIPYSESYEELYRNILSKNADYLYLGFRESSILVPAVRNALLDYKNPPEGLEIVTFIPYPPSVLYKVKK